MRLTCQPMLKKGVTCLLLFTSLFFYQYALGQGAKKTFRGTVANSKGEAVAGASVVVKGETGGTTTDNNGSFSIDAVEGATVVVSSIGFTSQEFTLRGNAPLSMKLADVTGGLENVVVVAYGTQKKKDITGAVAIVDVEEAKKYSASDISQLLEGRASGVQ